MCHRSRRARAAPHHASEPHLAKSLQDLEIIRAHFVAANKIAHVRRHVLPWVGLDSRALLCEQAGDLCFTSLHQLLVPLLLERLAMLV
jgi:hypothetical protein